MAYRTLLKAFLITAILLFLLFKFRPQQEALTTYSGIAMTIPYRIMIASDLPADQIEQQIRRLFAEIDATFNNWNPNSEVSKLNTSPANTPIQLSDELFTMLQEVDRLYKISEGRFDPAILPLLTVWKHALNHNLYPSSELIQKAQAASGWDKFTLQDHWQNHCIIKQVSDASLDLCGIAKGHAVDNLIDFFKKNNLYSAYVEWGGEIRVLGKHPSGRPWRVFVSCYEDTSPEHALKMLELEDSAVATSGDYLQNWRINNQSVSHIIDPLKGGPVEFPSGYKSSVTVKATTCLESDAIATAILAAPRGLRHEYISSIQKKIPTVQIYYFEYTPPVAL